MCHYVLELCGNIMLLQWKMSYILLYNDFRFNFYDLLNLLIDIPRVYVCLYIYLFIYINIYIHTHPSCICIYIYIYIHKHSLLIVYLVTLSISNLGCYMCINRNIDHWWKDNWQEKTELNGDKTVPITISVTLWKLTSQRYWQHGKIMLVYAKGYLFMHNCFNAEINFSLQVSGADTVKWSRTGKNL